MEKLQRYRMQLREMGFKNEYVNACIDIDVKLLEDKYEKLQDKYRELEIENWFLKSRNTNLEKENEDIKKRYDYMLEKLEKEFVEK